MEELYQKLSACCLEALQEDSPLSPLALAERMMSAEGVAMHCPEHHFIVPAALLTAAYRASGRSAAELEPALGAAAARAKRVPGGACGALGCCGAAVGGGIFAALLLGTAPKKEAGWAAANAMTARCLEHVASVGGPRCCKRVTYLALEEAVSQSPALLGLTLPGGQRAVCTRVAQNTECRGKGCPFFPGNGGMAQ